MSNIAKKIQKSIASKLMDAGFEKAADYMMGEYMFAVIGDICDTSPTPIGAATSMQILEVSKDQYGEPLTVMGKANAITAIRALLSTRDICKPVDVHICDENRGGAINVRHCAAQQTDEALEALKYVSICTRERTLPHKKLDENLSIIEKAILSSSGHLGIQGEWRPIDDNTPHEELLILGWYEGDTFKQEIALASAGERFSNGYSNRWQHGQAKYWMPLPPAPVSMTDDGGENA